MYQKEIYIICSSFSILGTKQPIMHKFCWNGAEIIKYTPLLHKLYVNRAPWSHFGSKIDLKYPTCRMSPKYV